MLAMIATGGEAAALLGCALQSNGSKSQAQFLRNKPEKRGTRHRSEDGACV
jgi:hypothetical protein